MSRTHNERERGGDARREPTYHVAPFLLSLPVSFSVVSLLFLFESIHRLKWESGRTGCVDDLHSLSRLPALLPHFSLGCVSLLSAGPVGGVHKPPCVVGFGFIFVCDPCVCVSLLFAVPIPTSHQKGGRSLVVYSSVFSLVLSESSPLVSLCSTLLTIRERMKHRAVGRGEREWRRARRRRSRFTLNRFGGSARVRARRQERASETAKASAARGRCGSSRREQRKRRESISSSPFTAINVSCLTDCPVCVSPFLVLTTTVLRGSLSSTACGAVFSCCPSHLSLTIPSSASEWVSN